MVGSTRAILANSYNQDLAYVMSNVNSCVGVTPSMAYLNLAESQTTHTADPSTIAISTSSPSIG